MVLCHVNFLNDLNVQTIIGTLTNYFLILPVFIFLMRKIESTKLDKESLSIKEILIYICIAMTLMWIGNIIGSIITSIIGFSMTNEITNPVEEMIQNSSIYINLIVISILAPIFEEIFFRKLLIDRTIKYGATLSILLSALMFALFHGNLSQFFYAFLLGLLFAFVYIKTGRITYSIILHAVVNFYGSVASVFFSASVENISQGLDMAKMGDIGIIAIYLAVLVIVWFIGLYKIITNYKKIELNDSKREVFLEKPTLTVFFNVGMILFVLYHIFKILLSLKIIVI
jgi:membrane protease YdiL (CAAX protease family)